MSARTVPYLYFPRVMSELAGSGHASANQWLSEKGKRPFLVMIDD
jgi:hypothetical protein